MGTGTAVATGDALTAAKMNLKLETVESADLGTISSLSLTAGTNPGGTYVFIARDNTSDLTVNAASGYQFHVAIAGTDEYDFSATALQVANGNYLQFLGNNGITDSAGNEVLLVSATGTALNYVQIANAATGAGPQIQAQGDNTNVDLVLVPKGTGAILIDQNSEGIALHVDSQQTTTNIVDIDTDTLTTGTAIDLSDANALTTGSAINITSNSSSTGIRNLLYVYNQHASAVNSIPLSIRQDAAGTVMFIDQNGNGPSLAIDAESTSANVVTIASETVTTGNVINVANANALTSGSMAYLVSNSADTSARYLVSIGNVNTAAVGAIPLVVTQQAANEAVLVVQNAAAEGIIVDQNGNFAGLYIDTEATTVTGTALDIEANTLTSGTLINIDNANALTSGSVINLVANGADTTARNLVYIRNQNTAAVGAIPLTIRQDAAQEALFIDQNGDGEALLIDAETTTGKVVDIDSTTVTAGIVLDIGDADALTTGAIANLVSNSSNNGTRNLVFVHNDNTGATGTTVLNVRQDAAQIAALLDQNGNAVTLSIDSEATTANVVDITAPITTTGTVLDISDADTLTSGAIANLTSTRAAGSMANRTTDFVTLAASREEQRTSGTTADDYDTVSVTRTSIANGAGGTLTSTGSALRVANVATQTAGTLTDTAAVLELVQDADSTGNALFINHDNAVGANVIDVDAEITTGIILNLQSNTLTTGTALDLGDGDSLTTGYLINAASNSTDNSARTLVYIHNTNASATGATPLTVEQDAAAQAVFINQDADGVAISIDAESTTAHILDINAPITTTGTILQCNDANALTSGKLADLESTRAASAMASRTADFVTVAASREEQRTSGTTADNYDLVAITRTSIANGSGGTLTATGSALHVENVATQTAGTLTDTTSVLELVQDADSTGMGLLLDQNGNGVSLSIDAESTSAHVIDINGPITTTGTIVQCDDANALTSGKLADLESTVAGTTLAARTADFVTLAASRSEARTTGATADDYDAVSITRTSITTGAGGTLTAAGSALRVANVATQTAGTLTDTAAVLELVQDADSTGNALFINHDNAAGATVILVDSEIATGIIADIDSSTLTTGKGLDLSDANALTTGTLVDLESNSSNNGAFKILNVVNNNTAAVGATPLAIQQDATAGFAVVLSGTGPDGLDVNGMKIDLDADGDTSITADTDDTIDFEISGADDFQMTANAFTLRTGSDIQVENATNEHAVFCSRNTVAYTDTANKTLFVIPANAQIIDVVAIVTTAFDAGTTNALNVGTTAGDPDEFVDALNSQTAGVNRMGDASDMPWAGMGTIGGTDATIYGKNVETGAGSAHGAATIYMYWTVA